MKHLYILFFILVLNSCSETEMNSAKVETSKVGIDKIKDVKVNDFAIVLHGGAGTILKENLTPELEAKYRAILEKAIRLGHDILKNDGTSLQAVEKVINTLEDSPMFNAGKGSVFTNAGTNEMDASIMSGAELNAGAVAGVKTVKNPISAAIKVMNESDHVMLSGDGADQFATQKGLEIVESSYFFTEKRFKSLERIKEKEAAHQHKLDTVKKETSYFYDEDIKDDKFGTVGCVALDKTGNIVAGTSTGGMTNKRWNRIGDTPIIGAGTYANNATCGVSATGWGEYFIRATVAHDISAMMEYKGYSLKKATHEVIQNKLTAMGGTGGVVALDYNGNMSFEFNTAGMYRASMDDDGVLVVEIFGEGEGK